MAVAAGWRILLAARHVLPLRPRRALARHRLGPRAQSPLSTPPGPTSPPPSRRITSFTTATVRAGDGRVARPSRARATASRPPAGPRAAAAPAAAPPRARSRAPHPPPAALPAALFEGGLRPHRYCLPILKHEDDRLALLAAVRGGSAKFFGGTDSAPHARGAKECPCGAAGMFTAHAAVELYALAFERAGCLSSAALARFLCESGADFYGMPRNADAWPAARVHLRRTPWRVPDAYALGEYEVVPAMCGEELPWKAVVVEGGV